MEKRNTKVIFCALLVVGYACLLGFLTIKAINPNVIQKVIIFVTYTFMCIFAGIDLFRAMEIKSEYNPEMSNKFLMLYHTHSFRQGICLVNIVAIGIILIVNLFFFKRYDVEFLVLVAIGVLFIVQAIKNHKKAMENWDFYILTRED